METIKKIYSEEEITNASNKAFYDLFEELNKKEFRILSHVLDYNININRKGKQITLVDINFPAKLNNIKFLKELGYLK